MTPRCPRCESDQIVTKDHARIVACSIGTIAGAVRGWVGATSGAELGAALGAVAGPPGIAIGGIAGAIVGAFVCGAAGGSAGAALGEIIDEKVLNNFLCLSCEFSFSKTNIQDPVTAPKPEMWTDVVEIAPR